MSFVKDGVRKDTLSSETLALALASSSRSIPAENSTFCSRAGCVRSRQKHGPKDPIMVIGGWSEPIFRPDILAEVEGLKRLFYFESIREVTTGARRSRLAALHMCHGRSCGEL